MNGKPLAFIDTNVLLYAIDADEGKKRKAVGLCEENAVISINVLNEFVNVSRRKFSRTFEEIREDVKCFLGVLSLVFPGFETFERALDIGETTGYSHFDSLIIAAAIEAGCSLLYSEDFQHQQTIEGKMKIVNPFRE